jgi:hypothetical protein
MKSLAAVLILSLAAFAQFFLPPAGDPWWKSETGKAWLAREKDDLSRWARNRKFKENFAAYCYWSHCNPEALDISRSLKSYYEHWAPVGMMPWNTVDCDNADGNPRKCTIDPDEP